MNNTFNITVKNQIEKIPVIDGKLKRKDSAIELEDIKNSFSDSEYIGIEKRKNSNLINSNNNKKVEFIVDDNNSDDESSDEKTEIFNLEIEPVKIPSYRIVSSSTSSISLYNASKNRSSKNLSALNEAARNKDSIYDGIKNSSIKINVKNSNFISKKFNNDYSSVNNNNNDYTNTNPKVIFQKILSNHIYDTPKKEGKIKFGNICNELKNSPTKYNGLDILKPILKKAESSNKEVTISCNSLSTTIKSLPKKKKSVHFKSENEECPFKKFECPSNIVNLPIYVVDSRLEPFLEAKLVKLKGFSSKKKVPLPWDKNVILESVGLIDDEEQEHDILKLTIQVRNIAFEKKVYVHLTFNNWETVEVREAKYRFSEKSNHNGNSDPNIDKFILKIDTDCDGESVCHIQFAIQYLVDQQEYWDNNNGNNYSLKVDRTVRIPAKAIKSHPFCEGPVVKYKLKPGYHYPLFKCNLTEHPSADVPETTKTKDSKDSNNTSSMTVSNDNNTNNNTSSSTTSSTPSTTACTHSISISCSENENSLGSSNKINETQSQSSEKRGSITGQEKSNNNRFETLGMLSNTRLSVDRSTLENIISPNSTFDTNEPENNSFTTKCISSEWTEEEKENTPEKEFFSWNEPILLRKPSTPERHYYFQNSSMGKGELLMHSNDSNSIQNGRRCCTTTKKEDVNNNSCANNNNDDNGNNNYSMINSKMIPLDSINHSNDHKYPFDHAFELPKHENWFKEAPSCIQFGTSPRKLYHHSNNFKLLNHHSLSKSLFGNKNQTLAISEKEKAEEEENKKRLNSKYTHSTHLPSSSSKYMRNNLYGNYQSLYPIYSSLSSSSSSSSFSVSSNINPHYTSTESPSSTKNNNDFNYFSNGYYHPISIPLYSNPYPPNSCYPSNSPKPPILLQQQNSYYSSNANPNPNPNANPNSRLEQNSCYLSNATAKEFTQSGWMKHSPSKNSTFTHYSNDYNIYSDSHLYATQEDFINDHMTYF